MKLFDRQGALTSGLATIREQFQVPEGFPPEVVATAGQAVSRPPSQPRADWTGYQFVTLDPATSTDLDQAFALESDGSDIILHYAIADVGNFVTADDPIDVEAWKRGTTIYLPDGKASLYPAILSEGAASLLPNGDRPAVVFTIRVDSAGSTRLDGAERATIRSRAKLAYEKVKSDDLPSEFTELNRRIQSVEDARGAERVDAPEQEVGHDESDRYVLQFRPQLLSEQQNASLSLAANLAIADAMLAHQTGLFRVMAKPEEWAVGRLRHTAKALGLVWPKNATLGQFERTLDINNPAHAAFRSAVRRASPSTGYEPYTEGVVPWHSAMAATYAHATAPLRRLADRYVVEIAVQIAAGQTVSQDLIDACQKLPKVMARAENRASQIDRAVLDLAEVVMLQGLEGSHFKAVVTDIDDRGTRIQLTDPAIVARIDGQKALPGDTIDVILDAADIANRQVKFRRVD